MTGMAAGAAALTGVGFGWWGVAAVAAAVLAVALVSREPRTWAGLGVVLLVAAGGAWHAGAVEGDGGTASVPRFITKATVVSAPVRTGQGQYFVAASAARGSAGPRICVGAGPFPAVRLGDTVALNVSPVSAADAPAGRRAGLALRGCAAAAFAPSVAVVGSVQSLPRSIAELRMRLNDVLRRAAPGDAGVLLAGLVTGDDDGFSPAREEAFRQTNTTHLTAVSGSNLALVAGIAATVGAATVGRHRFFWQAGTIAAVWLYAAVSGAQPPAVRAAVVASAAVLAFRVGRRPDFPTLILLAAGAMVLVEPRQIDALGFRLSVAASLALAFVLPALLADGRTWRGVDLVAGTIAAQLATLPFLLPVFGAVSLVSVPANVVVAPLAALAMPIAALAGVAGLVSEPVAEVIAAPAALLAAVMLGAVDTFAAAPGYVAVGIPPPAAAVILAVVASGVLMALCRATLRPSGHWLPEPDVPPVRRERSASRGAGRASRGLVTPLTPPPLGVVRGEDPADALGADPNDPEEEPSREEEGHELADERQGRQPVLGDVRRHRPVHEPGGDGEADRDREHHQHQHLPPLADDREVVAAEVVEPLHDR